MGPASRTHKQPMSPGCTRYNIDAAVDHRTSSEQVKGFIIIIITESCHIGRHILAAVAAFAGANDPKFKVNG